MSNKNEVISGKIGYYEMAKSSIEWTESTWNPTTGCTKISPGCKHCYAERMTVRLNAMGQPNYINGFKVSLHEHVLKVPLKWKRPQIIFVNSMSDLLHKAVPDEFILKVFDVMVQASHHRFQILTKRSKRLIELSPKLPWPDNVWMGVSVEDSDHVFRIEDLKKIDAKIKFVSFEPLLSPIHNLNLEKINWSIVGGESGPKARQMNPAWVRGIRDHCLLNTVPFFFKQWGGFVRKKRGRILDGKTWSQMPHAHPIFSSAVA